MPVYSYRGMTATGSATRGFVDADSDRTARAKLRRDGVYLTELLESSGKAASVQGTGAKRFSFSLDSIRGLSATDLAIATRQLATLLGAGIPLVESLGALTEQVENARLKTLIARVRDRVNEGATLADALADAGAFSELYVSMVRAGEAGGALEPVLQRLADYLESQVRTRNRVVSILMYPALMLGVAGLVVVALVTIVLPQITELLESLDKPLPIYTIAVIEGSEILANWWWAFLIVGALIFAGLQAAGRTERGRYTLDGLKLRVPIFGKLLRVLAISRFTRTLSTLLAGGIPIVRSLDIARHVAGNAVLGEAIDAARDAIVEGASISAPLRASGQFPPLVTHMVDVGERTGALEAMLGKVADTYDEQVENAVTRMTALLEPALILLMVGIVIVIILATLVPVLELTTSIE